MNDLTTKFDISTIEDQDLDFIQQQIMNRKLKSMMERIEQVETSRIRDKEELNIRQIGLENDIKDLKDDNEKKLGAIINISTVKENKWIYGSQSDFGSSFEVTIGAGTVGKLFKVIGLAKISKSKTEPLHDKIGKYATMETIKEHKTWRWNHKYCLEFLDNWLKVNKLYEEFYTIPNEKEMLKFIKKLYDEKLARQKELPNFN